jgi:fatty-acyl-CoA synthase
MITDTFNKVIANLRSQNTGLDFLDSGEVVSLTYADLGRLIIGNIEHFQSLGIGRGERVIISLKTDLEHIVSFLAFIAMGAIPISIKPARINNDIYVKYLGDLSSRFGIHYGYHSLPLPDGILPIAWRSDASSVNSTVIAEIEPQDLAFVQFSSGSTSLPKAIPISHANLMANLSAIIAVDQRDCNSRGFNFLPLSHDMGLVGGLLSNLVYQNSLLLAGTSQFLRRTVEILKIASDLHVNIMAIPDFALRYLSTCLATSRSKHLHKDIFSSLHTVYCGAEPIRLKSITSFLEVAVPFGLDPQALFFCYGLAEATLIVTGHRLNSIEESFDISLSGRAIAKLGTPLGGAEVRIDPHNIDSKENILEGKQIGGVQIRGPSVFKGYWDSTTENDWFDTGDIGFLSDGELRICGRSKDMIIVSGENIFPVDIESYLTEIKELKDSLVMVDEDQLYILAVPYGSVNLDTQRIVSFVGEHFGILPKAVIQGTSKDILRTTSGKPMRKETLRTLLKH